MQHRKYLVAAIAIGALIIPTVAIASSTPSSPNSFGGFGNPPVLKKNCSRSVMFLTPAGKTWDGAGANGKKYVWAVDNVLDNQIKCLIHRKNQSDAKLMAVLKCFTAAVPATAEAPADKQGYHDVQGLNAIRAYLKTQRDCVFTATGGVA